MAKTPFTPLRTILDFGFDMPLLGMPSLPTACLPALAHAGIYTADALVKLGAKGLVDIDPTFSLVCRNHLIAEARTAVTGDTDYDVQAMAVARVSWAKVPDETIRSFFGLSNSELMTVREIARGDAQKFRETFPPEKQKKLQIPKPATAKPKPIPEKIIAVEKPRNKPKKKPTMKDPIMTAHQRRKMWEEEKQRAIAEDMAAEKTAMPCKAAEPTPSPLPPKPDFATFVEKEDRRHRVQPVIKNRAQGPAF